MGGKTAIGLGLASGVLAGGLAIAVLVALAPVPAKPASPATPSATAPGAGATGAPASAPPSVGTTPSADTTPSGDAPEPSATSLAQAFGIGEPAPPLELPGVGGEPVNLTDYLGRPVWVNFMATWCPPCQDELPLMAGFQARFDDNDLVVIAVDVKEDEPTVQAFFAELGIYFPVGLDVDGAAQAEWGAIALPVHYWIDRDGIVREGALGGIGPDVMAVGLQAIMPGVSVTP